LKFLFVHQNFPGQFRHVAAALAENPENEVVGLGEAANLRGRPLIHPRLQVFEHTPKGTSGRDVHSYARDFDAHIRRGQSAAQVAMNMRERGFVPDVVMAHPAWGEALFLRDVFPDARHISYFEYFYQGNGGDVGFDPARPVVLDDLARLRVKNSTQLSSLLSCDEGLSPTHWQKSRYPEVFQPKLRVIHEGVDTTLLRPEPQAWVQLRAAGRRFAVGDEVVTYVARNLEPYRGFDVFMRALPTLQALRPNAHVLVVGGNSVSYGAPPPNGETWQTVCRRELGDRVDWSRVSFVGKLAYADYLKVLQVSAAHVYLTYPFVLSWSMLEAMSAGCALVASRTTPVMEVVRDGENGLLVDFYDHEALAEKVAGVLARPDDFRAMRVAARQTAVDEYDLHSRCLPEMLAFLKSKGQKV